MERLYLAVSWACVRSPNNRSIPSKTTQNETHHRDRNKPSRLQRSLLRLHYPLWRPHVAGWRIRHAKTSSRGRKKRLEENQSGTPRRMNPSPCTTDEVKSLLGKARRLMLSSVPATPGGTSYTALENRDRQIVDCIALAEGLCEPPKVISELPIIVGSTPSKKSPSFHEDNSTPERGCAARKRGVPTRGTQRRTGHMEARLPWLLGAVRCPSPHRHSSRVRSLPSNHQAMTTFDKGVYNRAAQFKKVERPIRRKRKMEGSP